MTSAFPPKCVVVVGNLKMQELICVLRHCVKCKQTHNTKYNKLNCLYLAVKRKLYALYAPLVYDNDWDPVMDEADVQERQDIPDDPEYPG